MMSLDIYLQIISILMGVIAVVVPIGITVVGFVYVKQLTAKIESLSTEVNLLWNKVEDA